VGGPFLFPSRHVKHLPIMPLKGQAQGIDIFCHVYELSFESSGSPRTLWIAQAAHDKSEFNHQR
jgi:hypothetical protein